MNKSKRKLRGFTLLELIIVIAIISVLTAIIVPNIIDSIRTNRILSANTQAQQIYMAAQDYLVNEQIKGITASDITGQSGASIPRVCWIEVTTEIGTDSDSYDKSNKTTVVNSSGIKNSTPTDNTGFTSRTMADGTTSYPIADGIESRLDSSFKGSWIVAFYPKTFTVAYAVYNDNYGTAAECEAAVELIGTTDGRLYYTEFGSAATAKQSQENDFMHPDTVAEAPHLYTGQFPIRNFSTDPV